MHRYGQLRLTIYEQLHREFGSKVEGVQFTIKSKETMAVNLKRRMEEAKLRLPDTEVVRNSFRSVRETVTALGQARFDSEHDQRYGHADHFWACALAESAAGARLVLGLVELQLQHLEAEQQSITEVAYRPDGMCCDTPLILKRGLVWHCNACGGESYTDRYVAVAAEGGRKGV